MVHLRPLWESPAHRGNVAVIDMMAATCAELGRFGEAIQIVEMGRQLALKHEDASAARMFTERKTLYRDKKPLRGANAKEPRRQEEMRTDLARNFTGVSAWSCKTCRKRYRISSVKKAEHYGRYL